jgi:hypothetical protein
VISGIGIRSRWHCGKISYKGGVEERRFIVANIDSITRKGTDMSQKGSIGMLFDLSFTEFVTTRLIKVLFVIGIIFAAIGAIALIVSGFGSGAAVGILFLILSPLVFFFYVLIVRVWCEIIIVVFRIAENTSRLVDQNKQ